MQFYAIYFCMTNAAIIVANGTRSQFNICESNKVMQFYAIYFWMTNAATIVATDNSS
jgi:hypothetical protein